MGNEWDDWLKGRQRSSLIIPDIRKSPFKSTLFGQHELPGRIRVANPEGNFIVRGLKELGWSKHKLTNLLRYIQENRLTIGRKSLMLADGTQIRMKEVEGNTRIDIMVPEVAKVEEKKKRKRIREHKTSSIAPALACYSWLPGSGNYYYMNVPELFAIMPDFKTVRYAYEPTDIGEFSEKIAKTYYPILPEDEIYYSPYKGCIDKDVQKMDIPPSDIAGRRLIKREVKIRELWNITTPGTDSEFDYDTGFLTKIPPNDYEGNVLTVVQWTPYIENPQTTIYPGYDTMEGDQTYVGYYDIIHFGNTIRDTHTSIGHGDYVWYGGSIGNFTNVYGEHTSVGNTNWLGIKIVNNDQITKNFKSRGNAYAFNYDKNTYNSYISGTYTYGFNVYLSCFYIYNPFADTYNGITVTYGHYLNVYDVLHKKTNELLLWEETCTIGFDGYHYGIDWKMFDYHGVPVFLFSYWPHPGTQETDRSIEKVWYMMVYGDRVIRSEIGYEKVGSSEYPHILPIPQRPDETWYASGYMRLVEIEETNTYEEVYNE